MWSLALVAVALGAPAQNTLAWKALAPGVDYGEVAGLNIVRIAPDSVELVLWSASQPGERARTAAEWCRTKDLDVAINAGMFGMDRRTNVGFMKRSGQIANAKFNDYRSLFAFGPRSPAMFDLDLERGQDIVREYANAVQNLRLIKADRVNVWKKNQRKWSEAAIATDHRGRVLFIFSRVPHTMFEFNELLLSLDLDVKNAMHVEGGPEASLSIHLGGTDLDLAGSFETGFNENETNQAQWALPNIIGVRARHRAP